MPMMSWSSKSFAAMRRRWGLDADAVVTAAKASKRASTRTVAAPEPFPVNPQRERQEAQKRLNERIKTTARVLLNRIDLTPGGSDISRNLLTNMSGSNFRSCNPALQPTRQLVGERRPPRRLEHRRAEEGNGPSPRDP